MDIGGLFTPAFLYQTSGWIAVALYLISFQLLNPRKTIFLWGPADFLMAVHFFGIGAIIPMITAIGGTFRSLIAVYGSKRLLQVYIAVYLIVVSVCVYILAQAVEDYLTLVGTVFMCLSVLYQERFVLHRLFAFGHQSFWTAVFILIGSWPGLVLILCMMGSNVTGFARYCLEEKVRRRDG